MGSVISCCATEAICCAGSLCCSLLCLPCKHAGVPAKNFAKIGYTIFQLIFVIVGLILMWNAQKLGDMSNSWPWRWFSSDDADSLKDCPAEFNLGLDENACLGTALMLRMSFALCIFHTLVFLIILARNDLVAAFHDGCWGTKALFVTLIFIVSLWFSNDFIMGGFLKMTKWISMIFLLYQALLMLVVAYKINDSLVSNAEND